MAAFEALWDVDDAVRLAAITDFLQQLEPATSTPTTSSTSIDDLHPDILYALKRLARGLASPRDAARLGFATTLAELLVRLPDCPVTPIVDLVLTHTEVTGSTKGEEARDRNFGRLVGLAAIISSGILFSTRTSSIRNLQTVCNALLVLSDHKSYLKESAGKVIVDLIERLPKEASWQTAAKHAILAASRAETAEYVAWVLAFGVEGVDNPLHSSQLQKTARILKTTHSSNSVEGNPHFVWTAIAATEPSTETITALTSLLLTRESTPTQRREGLLALSLLLRSPVDLSHDVFQLAVEASAKGRPSAPGMAVAAKKLLSHLVSLVKADPATGCELLERLISNDGTGFFNALSQSNALDELVAALDDASKERWAAQLETIIVKPAGADLEADEDKPTTHLRRWAIEQLSAIGSTESIDFLCVHGFFTITKESKKAAVAAARIAPSPPLPPVLHQLCQARLYTLLSRDLVLLKHASQTLVSLAGQAKYLSPTSTAEADVSTLRQAAFDILNSLDGGSDASKALATLLRCIILISFEDASSASEPLDMLLTLLPRLTNAEEAMEEDEEVSADTALVELLLSLLQRPQTVVRPVVEEVFKAFATDLSEESIDSLIEMIAPDFLAETEDEGADVDEEAAANAAINGAMTNGKHDEDSSDDDVDSDDALSDMDGEDLILDLGGDVNAELKAKVEAALKEHNVAADSEDEAGEDQEEEEELLDDEQMFALDEQLAAAFRSESKGTSRKAAKLQDTNARLKVLDLLAVYARSAPASPLLPRIVGALHAATTDADLTAKAQRTLTAVVKTKAANAANPASEEAARSLSKLLAHPGPSPASTLAATYLLRLLPTSSSDGDNANKLASTTLLPALERFTRSKRPPTTETLFTALAKIQPGAFTPHLHLFTILAQDEKARPMRRRQAARFAASLLQLPGSMEIVGQQPLSHTLRSLVTVIDPSEKAETSRETLKALASLLRHASKVDNIDEAIKAHGKLGAGASAETAFGGSGPCRALVVEINRLAEGGEAPLSRKRKKAVGATNGVEAVEAKAKKVKRAAQSNR